MFTGITRGTFEVIRLVRGADSLDFEIWLPGLVQGLEIGASLAIDGVCHTVVAIEGKRVRLQSIGETLRRTTLGSLKQGDRVSVERSFRVGDEVGGHEVSGHVIGTGTIIVKQQRDTELALCIRVPAAWMKYIQHKGFIAVDGSSLTVGEVDARSQPASSDGSKAMATARASQAYGTVWLHLVPETLRLTRFASKQVGDEVNVELDARTVAVVDTVERLLNERLPGLLEQRIEGWLDARLPELLKGQTR